MSEALQIGLGVGIPAAIIIGTLSYLSIPRKKEEILHDPINLANQMRVGGKRRKSRKNKKNFAKK